MPVLRNATSLLLIVLLEVMPITLSSADFSTGAGILGTITGSGAVLLRGIGVREVGTVFSGDNIHTGDKSQAHLIFANGNRVQLASNTTFVADRKNQVVQLLLISGEIAFSASKSPVTIVCGDYQIAPEPNSSGKVVIANADFAAVRVATGSVTLRIVKRKSTVVLSSGSVRILNLRTGQQQEPPVQLASTMPTRLPKPQLGRVGPDVNTLLWGAVIVGGVAAAVLIPYELTKCTKASPSAPCK
jgi:ferric-dicitrate binding protein FerR (iron transport regulator)